MSKKETSLKRLEMVQLCYITQCFDRFGRRIPYCAFMLIGGVAGMLVLAVPSKAGKRGEWQVVEFPADEDIDLKTTNLIFFTSLPAVLVWQFPYQKTSWISQPLRRSFSFISLSICSTFCPSIHLSVRSFHRSFVNRSVSQLDRQAVSRAGKGSQADT